MRYTKVAVKDWNGETGLYDVIEVIKREKGKYSCVFVNSSGDIEKMMVNEQCLYQG